MAAVSVTGLILCCVRLCCSFTLSNYVKLVFNLVYILGSHIPWNLVGSLGGEKQNQLLSWTVLIGRYQRETGTKAICVKDKYITSVICLLEITLHRIQLNLYLSRAYCLTFNPRMFVPPSPFWNMQVIHPLHFTEGAASIVQKWCRRCILISWIFWIW